MIRKLIYVVVFLIGFIFTFLITFPAKTVLGYYLSQNKINYSSIDGNIFNLKIHDLEVGNIYIPELTIENSFFKVIIKLNMENFLDVDFIKRKAKLKLTELYVEKYQKKPEIKGIVSTSTKFMKEGGFIVAKGNGNFLVKYLPITTFNNTEVRWKLTPEGEHSVVDATLKGKNIDGVFKGKLVVPIGDKRGIRLKGIFTGKVFGRNVKQEININPLMLRGL
jgi:hypothetical protein